MLEAFRTINPLIAEEVTLVRVMPLAFVPALMMVETPAPATVNDVVAYELFISNPS